MAEVQLYRQNEGRHAVLLGLGRQLFRSLHDMSESDFDDEALQLYEDRERSKKSREAVTELGKRRITGTSHISRSYPTLFIIFVSICWFICLEVHLLSYIQQC